MNDCTALMSYLFLHYIHELELHLSQFAFHSLSKLSNKHNVYVDGYTPSEAQGHRQNEQCSCSIYII